MDEVRTHIQVCVQDIEDMLRHLAFKKVFAPWFPGHWKKYLPCDFLVEKKDVPRDFFNQEKSPPRDLRCSEKYLPRCLLTGPVSDKFCQLPYQSTQNLALISKMYTFADLSCEFSELGSWQNLSETGAGQETAGQVLF